MLITEILFDRQCIYKILKENCRFDNVIIHEILNTIEPTCKFCFKKAFICDMCNENKCVCAQCYQKDRYITHDKFITNDYYTDDRVVYRSRNMSKGMICEDCDKEKIEKTQLSDSSKKLKDQMDELMNKRNELNSLLTTDDFYGNHPTYRDYNPMPRDNYML